MAKININLLPRDLVGSASVSKAAEIIKRVAIGLASLLVVLVALAVSLFLIFSTDLKREQGVVDSLITNIKNLEGVEQKFYLIRDRVQKAGVILKARTVEAKVGGLTEVVSFLPAEATLTEAEIDANKTKLTLTITDSSALAAFLSRLMAANIYPNLVLKNFTFVPTSGYLIILEAI